MAFIRVKNVNGTNYYYLVESVREDGKVKQKLIRYFGKKLNKAYMTKGLKARLRIM